MKQFMRFLPVLLMAGLLNNCNGLLDDSTVMNPPGNPNPTDFTYSPCLSSHRTDPATLPLPVVSYVAATYSGTSILEAHRYSSPAGTAYGLHLSNGQHLLIQANGVVVAQGDYSDDDIDVAVANLPQSVRDYVAANFPQLNIVRAELETEFGLTNLEVYLSDETIELYFTADGAFLCLDNRRGGINDDDDDDSNDDNGSGGNGSDDDDDDNGGSGSDDDDDDDDDNGGSGSDDNGGGSNDDNPVNLPASAQAWLQANYPGYQISSSETEDWCGHVNIIEVELEVHNGEDIHVYFALDGTYLFTGIERPFGQLPTAVTSGLAGTYPAFVPGDDEAEFLTLADGSLQYVVKIRPTANSGKIRLLLDAAGNVVCTL